MQTVITDSVLLVFFRFVEEKMWVTYLEGYSALAALSLSASTVNKSYFNVYYVLHLLLFFSFIFSCGHFRSWVK